MNNLLRKRPREISVGYSLLWAGRLRQRVTTLAENVHDFSKTTKYKHFPAFSELG